MKILIDNLSITWKYDNLSYLYERLGLVDIEINMQPIRTKFYPYGEYYCGILIAYNMDETGKITDTFLDMSGRGCRTVEELNPDWDWFEFLHEFHSDYYSHKSNISRIDIACDITDGSVPYSRFFRYSNAGMYTCKAKCLPKIVIGREETIYFGSSKSDRILRIYNKALEQGIPDTDWTRLEFQLRNDNAMSFYLNWCNAPSDIGSIYCGMLRDYLRFVEVPRGQSMKQIRLRRHQDRLNTCRWWLDLLSNAAAVRQLYLPREGYTLDKLEQYLERQTYSSLKAYMIAHDGDMTKIIDGVNNKRLNAKQQQLISELERIKQTTAKESLEE